MHHIEPNSPQIRIGVTGHRFLAGVAKLRAAVEDALSRIENVLSGRRLVVLSPLAEGAGGTKWTYD